MVKGRVNRFKSFRAFGKKVGIWSLENKRPRRVAFNTELLLSSWGGSNQFLKQFAPYLAARGVEIVYELDPLVTHIIILDVRPIVTATFTMEDIRVFKKKYPEVKVLLRINNCDKKYTHADYAPGYENLDEQIMRADKLATHTAFISHWLKAYFIRKGYKIHNSCDVIQNASDPEVFFPGEIEWHEGEVLKIVTHHWSDNWLKGYKVYQEIDEMIASSELKGFSLTVIGRWPQEIKWKVAKTYGPCQGYDLAEKLRQHHLYVTASLWEPGGMHFIEGMQCGLPVIYHVDGGGIPEVAGLAGVGFRDSVKTALLDARSRYRELRRLVLEKGPNGANLCNKFYKLIFDENNDS